MDNCYRCNLLQVVGYADDYGRRGGISLRDSLLEHKSHKPAFGANHWTPDINVLVYIIQSFVFS